MTEFVLFPILGLLWLVGTWWFYRREHQDGQMSIQQLRLWAVYIGVQPRSWESYRSLRKRVTAAVRAYPPRTESYARTFYRD